MANEPEKISVLQFVARAPQEVSSHQCHGVIILPYSLNGNNQAVLDDYGVSGVTPNEASERVRFVKEMLQVAVRSVEEHGLEDEVSLMGSN